MPDEQESLESEYPNVVKFYRESLRNQNWSLGNACMIFVPSSDELEELLSQGITELPEGHPSYYHFTAVQGHVADGSLPSYDEGSRTFVRPEEFLDWISGREPKREALNKEIMELLKVDMPEVLGGLSAEGGVVASPQGIRRRRERWDSRERKNDIKEAANKVLQLHDERDYLDDYEIELLAAMLPALNECRQGEKVNAAAVIRFLQTFGVRLSIINQDEVASVTGERALQKLRAFINAQEVS